MAFTPRGRIDQSTIALLRDGIRLHEASEIIGLGDGCHDGFSDEHHHFLRRKDQQMIAYWVNADGAIIVELPGEWEIRNARYVSRIDELSFSFIGMLNDRIVNRMMRNTVGRLLRSESAWSSIILWIGVLTLSAFPAVLVGACASVSRKRIWLVSVISGLVVYFAIALSSDRLLLHHTDYQFQEACPAVCVSVLVFSIVYACYEAARLRFASTHVDTEDGEPTDAHGAAESTLH
ncbi:MAG: hypothetical protein ACR2NZ_22910 [Rubripirellula sp.]